MASRWIHEEDGQDLVEYSLLLAFVVLAGAASYRAVGINITALWSIVNDRLTSASN
jgi:Flp pilus assembly pilin Flp